MQNLASTLHFHPSVKKEMFMRKLNTDEETILAEYLEEITTEQLARSAGKNSEETSIGTQYSSNQNALKKSALQELQQRILDLMAEVIELQKSRTEGSKSKHWKSYRQKLSSSVSFKSSNLVAETQYNYN